MKLMTYSKILTMTKEGIDKALAPIRAKQAKTQCELAMSKIEEEMLSKEARVHELCAVHPLNVDAVINALDDVAILERRHGKVKVLMADLFGKD